MNWKPIFITIGFGMMLFLGKAQKGYVLPLKDQKYHYLNWLRGNGVNYPPETWHLLDCIIHNEYDSLVAILGRGVSPDWDPCTYRNQYYATPLYFAMHAADTRILGELVGKVNCSQLNYALYQTTFFTPNDESPEQINAGITKKRLDLAAQLLDAGADGNFFCHAYSDGGSALHAMLVGNQLAQAKLLIARGVDVNYSIDHYLEPPVLIAARNGDTAMLDLLHSAGADLFKPWEEECSEDCFGETDIVSLAFALPDSIRRRLIPYLVQKGAGWNRTYCREDWQESLLGKVARNGDLEDVQFLVTNGAEVNPKHAISPFVEAGAWGKYENARFLVEHGANIQAKNQDGLNALEAAIRCCGIYQEPPVPDRIKTLNFLHEIGLKDSALTQNRPYGLWPIQEWMVLKRYADWSQTEVHSEEAYSGSSYAKAIFIPRYASVTVRNRPSNYAPIVGRWSHTDSIVGSVVAESGGDDYYSGWISYADGYPIEFCKVRIRGNDAWVPRDSLLEVRCLD